MQSLCLIICQIKFIFPFSWFPGSVCVILLGYMGRFKQIHIIYCDSLNFSVWFLIIFWGGLNQYSRLGDNIVTVWKCLKVYYWDRCCVCCSLDLWEVDFRNWVRSEVWPLFIVKWEDEWWYCSETYADYYGFILLYICTVLFLRSLPDSTNKLSYFLKCFFWYYFLSSHNQ